MKNITNSAQPIISFDSPTHGEGRSSFAEFFVSVYRLLKQFLTAVYCTSPVTWQLCYNLQGNLFIVYRKTVLSRTIFSTLTDCHAQIC